MKRAVFMAFLIISSIVLTSCDISPYIQPGILTPAENAADAATQTAETLAAGTDTGEVEPPETTAELPPEPANPRAADPEETSPSPEAPAPAVAAEPEKPHIFTNIPRIGEYKTPYHCTKHSRIFNETYHQPGVLLSGIITDPKELSEWLARLSAEPVKTEECDISDFNIYEAVKLGVTREQLEEFSYGTNGYYLWDLNIDLLMSDDAASVEEYYSSEGDYAGMMNRYGLLKIKLALESLVGIPAMAEFYGSGDTDIDTLVWTLADREAEWSISDFVTHFDISEEQLVGVVRSCLNESAGREVAVEIVESDKGRYVMPDAEYSEREFSDIFSRINLDRLYTEDGLADVMTAAGSGMRPVLVDELICSDLGK